MTKPFNIVSADINRLSDIQLTQLLNELLHAEAHKFGIAERAVDVALNIRVGDGGEDGRISWLNGPDHTDFIPNRLTMFQNKATNMAAAEYANEIVTKRRPGHPSVLKPKVEEILDQGGCYVVFTTQELNSAQKDIRILALRERIREQGKAYSEACEILIYDAAQIAGWANNFIPTIVSVQHWVGRPIERGLKTFTLWSEHEDLNGFPFASVDSRNDIVASLAGGIAEPKSCYRLMGLSGLGKTRTAFHIFDENETIRNLVVYIDANHTPDISALVADWVSLQFQAIIVVDNCEYRLHERLAQEVRRDGSQISLLSLDYNFDSVSPDTVCFRLDPMTDDELLQLLNPVYKEQLPDLDRIARFAQGFPQMAVLLAEARLTDDPRIGELSEDDLAHKLLWGRDGAENPDYLKILRACSLFDVFGIEEEAEPQLEYIAEFIGLTLDQVYECIQRYSERGLIDRRGRYGQLVPKPLAIRLAGQWWGSTRQQTHRNLVEGIPEGMVEGFCHQVEKMDFHPEVKALTEQLCGPQAPFGQAEVILSNRGSRLFRSFAIVNPEASTNALYTILVDMDNQQIHNIGGDVRRNLVWSLERLCYHAAYFDRSGWCMLLLAVAENENWSNNATGMFAQLLRINLSGTEAEPAARFALLNRAMDLNDDSCDLVLLEALSQAIEIRGSSRTVGAEYQGSKAPLEDWRPTLWQEIFDYWQEAFNLLLRLYERGDTQKEKVLSEIGHSIRGFVSRGRIDMLDLAIRQIVDTNGRYWPAALDSIKSTFEYDSSGMRPEAKEALDSWVELLSPNGAELPEKLKILVINPPWENRRGQDGHYVDIAAENAKALAAEVAKDLSTLIPYIHMLLQGDQKQSLSFGYQLSIEGVDVEEILGLSLEHLVAIDSPNPSFCSGILKGLYERSPDDWQIEIDRLLNNQKYIRFYPDFIRTGVIQKLHLDALLDIIQKGLVPSSSANVLAYGSVTDSIDPGSMAEFCLSLAEVGRNSKWTALHVIYMYCFSNKGSIETLRVPLKILVSSVPLHKGGKETGSDTHNWHDLAQKLLTLPDEQFALDLTNQLLEACKHELDHSDIWNYTKPLLLEIMRDYGEALWPVFGDAIVDAKGSQLYWLQQLLDRENSSSIQMPSVLSVVPVQSVISWCESIPEKGPGFVASCVNILNTTDDVPKPSDLFVALLERFGGDEKLRSALSANMGTRGWSGSLVPILEADKAALSTLLDSRSEHVRRWVGDHIAYIERQISYESKRDSEQQLGIY